MIEWPASAIRTHGVSRTREPIVTGSVNVSDPAVDVTSYERLHDELPGGGQQSAHRS